MPSSRLFLAIPIPANIRKDISGQVNSFSGISGVRLTPPDNYHITVHFFGNIEDGAIEGLKNNVADITAGHAAFTMQINQLAIHNQRHAKILWASFFPNNAFLRLAVDVQKMAIEKWRSKQEKEQTPHLTCARIKNNNAELPSLPQITQYEIPVAGIELWKTISEKGGVKYLSLRHFSLGT